MTTKQQLAEMLENSGGEYISGNTLAQVLGITRAAVWKIIRQLQEDGYEVEAVKNRGYRLGPENDAVSENCIRRYLKEYESRFPLEVRQSITSTNQVLKSMAAEAPGWYTIVAGSQSEGRGRRTRSFYSPRNTGIYLSVLIKLPLAAMEATRITTAAAVACCRAVEECTDAVPGIKWVNDVFVNGRKICGILTEASISMESGQLDWAVMGIGINVYEPEDGFPEEIRSVAGAVSSKRKKDLRSRLAASFLIHFYQICSHLMSPLLAEEYKKRCFILGLPVLVLQGDSAREAVAEDLDDDCGLVVRYPDGSRQTLTSGEVSIRVPADSRD